MLVHRFSLAVVLFSCFCCAGAWAQGSYRVIFNFDSNLGARGSRGVAW
jgi:hypothetical protein